MSTIFALSSAAGRSAVAVIRVSGPETRSILSTLTRNSFRKSTEFVPRMMKSVSIQSNDGELIDHHALAVLFPRPKSATGEDVGELHVHGSRAVVRSVLDAISSLSVNGNIRPANPGEFTRRALENGKMDLLQVEALADVLHADTKWQLQYAVRAASGAVAARVQSWQSEVTTCLAHVEALIDFADDETNSVPSELLTKSIIPKIQKVSSELASALKTSSTKAPLLRQGIRVALVGHPNAGKSSLFNALVGRAASIVSPIAGTTRDVVTASVDMQDKLLTFMDTAGVRVSPGDEIEAQGIERALETAKNAHVIVVVVDVSGPVTDDEAFWGPIRSTVAESHEACPVVVVFNKVDLMSEPDSFQVRSQWTDFATRGLGVGTSRLSFHFTSCAWSDATSSTHHVSSVSSAVMKAVDRIASQENADSTADLDREIVFQLRHVHHLRECATHLQAFVQCAQRPHVEQQLEFLCEELRLASKQLSEITGAGFTVSDVLNRIFSDFCIGK